MFGWSFKEVIVLLLCKGVRQSQFCPLPGIIHESFVYYVYSTTDLTVGTQIIKIGQFASPFNLLT